MPTLTPSSDEVRIYEIAVMYAADLDPKSESTLTKELEENFSEAGAKILFRDAWSKRGLAYPIGGHREAKYIITYVELDPGKIRELDREIKLQKNILRHLIVIPPKGYEARNFEELYQAWLKSRVSIEDIRKKKQEEKVKETVVASAKRAVKRMGVAKKKEEPKEVEMEKLSEKLEELISDDDLKI